ncbi:MAG: cation:proton antiporter [Gemmatimonadaceae bacterium]
MPAMQDSHAFLQNLALVLCTAAITTVVFQRLKLPVIFGYLIAGMIVGPYTPIPLSADEEMVRTLSELGVILLMFSLGLEFRLKRVGQIAATSGLAALLETSIMVGLGYLAGQLFGWTSLESIFTGAIVAISSTTIIARAFDEQGIQGRLREIVFGILIVEDLIAIILIALLTATAQGAGLSAGSLAITVIRLVTFLMALIGFGLLIVPRFVRRVIQLDRAETTLVASIAICFAAAFLAQVFGYSVALGAFIAGSLVAESGQSLRIEKLVHPVRDMFVAIFFVSVGMLIDPRVIADHVGAVIALSVIVITGKFLAVSMGSFITGNGLRASMQTGMSLAQIGEFSFIIAAVGLATGATRGFLYPVAVAVSAITTLATPWLIRAAGPAALWVDRKLPHPVQTSVALYGSWIERMRNSPRVGGASRTRKFVRVILVDAFVLAAIIIGAAAERGRFTTLLSGWTGITEGVAAFAVLLVAVALAVPMVIGIVRSARMLGFILAMRALPGAGRRAVDFAAAPRRALVTMLQLGTLFMVGAPLIAITQPFLPRFPGFIVLILLTIVLSFAFWRSALNLQGHAQAGAQVIVAALTPKIGMVDDSEDLNRTMEHVAIMLPGLGEPVPVRIAPGSPGADRSLAQMNLRGMTGATVLAVTRNASEGSEVFVPSGKTVLRAGDVVALAGPNEAVEAALQLLGVDRRAERQP